MVVVTKEDRPIQRVLIAYSGSMQSAKTMRRFVQMQLWPNASLRIVTFSKDAAAGDERLEHAAEYCRAHGLDPQIECVRSPSLGQLLPYAREHNSDLIVLGNSARNMLLRKILGETALDVMRNTDRSLFLAQ